MKECDNVTDAAILAAWDNARWVKILKKKYSFIKQGQIKIDKLDVWLPLVRVLQIIGVTPQMLEPIFGSYTVLTPRPFPFGWRWFGLNKQWHAKAEEFPRGMTTYDQLQKFPLTEDNRAFSELAGILKKTIKVYGRIDGKNYYLFVARFSIKQKIVLTNV